MDNSGNNGSGSNASAIAMMNAFTSSINSPTSKGLEEQSLKTQKSVQDAYQNSALNIGSKDIVESFTSYGFSNNTLNWTLWLALYNDSWVFRRAIDKPAQDIAGHGIDLHGPTDKAEVIEELERQLFGQTEMLMWGALFGGSVSVLMFDRVKLEYMYQSIDKAFHDGLIDKNSIMKQYVTDRWYGISPTNDDRVSDLKSRHFGKPKYYEISFADGARHKIHHTWVIRYEHRIAPNLVKRGMLQNWGYAEGSHLLNELSRDDKLKSSIHSLIDKSLIEVIKMSGMRGVFMGADQDNEAQLKKRLEMVNWGRNFNSLTFLDKDDDYQQNTFPGLSGLSDLLEKNMWLVAAAMDMQGILFGDLKGGFSNDAEAMVRYNETIQLRKNSYYREPLTHLLEVIYKMYGIEDDIKFDFNSLVVKSEEDELRDLQSFGTFLSTMISDGVMTPQQVAKTLKSYSEKSGVELHITDADIDALKDTTAEEMENIDFDSEYDEGDAAIEEPKKKKKRFRLFGSGKAEDVQNEVQNEHQKKYKLTKKATEDAFIEDMRHISWIEQKYKSQYPSIRIAWYDVNPKSQARSKITLTPSLYVFDDKHPVGRNSGAFKYSIRFSDHGSRFNCKDDIRMPRYTSSNAHIYEAAADKYIAKNPKLMEELYGT